MADKHLTTAALVVVAILLIAAVAWYLTDRNRTARDAGTLARAAFQPVPISPCLPVRDEGYYGVDLTARNAAGTVVWEPYSTMSRVSLERAAESPEVAEPANPITGIGKTSALRAMADRYRRGEALQRLSIYEARPGQPGHMEEIGDDSDSEMSLLALVARRSAPLGAHPPTCPASALTIAAADSPFREFLTDGPYGVALRGA